MFLARRVHITTSVLNCLNGDYDVEEGRGQERDSYLKQYNIESYLIVAEHPRVSTRRYLISNDGFLSGKALNTCLIVAF